MAKFSCYNEISCLLLIATILKKHGIIDSRGGM